MNKKTKFLLLAIILVLGLFLLLNTNIGSTLSKDDKDFKVSNTKDIDKIFISNPFKKEYILVEKKEGEWIANKKFKANTTTLDILFETLQKIEVKSPISNDGMDNVKKKLIVKGSKVEIYKNGKIHKIFYVGENTPDELGTYFYIDKAKEPFICHIPGFHGFIGSRFTTKLTHWRSKQIFKATEEEIKSIKIEWNGMPNESFEITKDGNLKLISNNKTYDQPNQINLNLVKTYLSFWENLSFVGFPESVKPPQIDSISKTSPLLKITLIKTDGTIQKAQLHLKPVTKNTKAQTDRDGNPLEFDIEEFYAFVNENYKEIVIVQDYVFGKVMKKTSNFMLK